MACDGPLLLNVMGTETEPLTLAVAGAETVAVTSAMGVTPVVPLAVLLALLESVVAVLTVLFTVTLPVAGAVYDRVILLTCPGLRVAGRPEIVMLPVTLSYVQVPPLHVTPVNPAGREAE